MNMGMWIPVRIVRMLSGTDSLRNALRGDAYRLLEIPGDRSYQFDVYPRGSGKREGRMGVKKRMVFAFFLLAMAPVSLWAAGENAPAKGSVPVGAPEAVVEPDYVIGPGDTLNIEVWKDPTLTRLVTVLPDGKVAYPLMGEIMAGGKTASQLQKEIEGRLSLYVKDVVVTVEVRQLQSLQIYVLGKVRTPGRIILTSNIDVLQAMALAGGPDQFAKLSRIRIIRREGGKTVIIPFDYDDVIAGKHLESNILLRRGDVIVVP
jgi:polysaccharide export outer membrane protein